MTDEAPLKRCTKCGQEYPANSDFFHRRNDVKNDAKLHAQCKWCKRASNKRRWKRQQAAWKKIAPNDLKADTLNEAVARRAWSRANIRVDDNGRWKNYWED